MNRHGQTICLNMIVKNEAPVIRRCLDSIRPLIDTWVIVDTGSTDGTQEIIREHLRDVPGELFERPWVNFAHNRTEALALAKGRAEYVFVIDADEIVELEEGFELPQLEADSYNVEMLYGGYAYRRKQFVRDALPWQYTGVLHEYIHCGLARTESMLEGMRTVPRHDGARARDPHTYRRDALLLESALLDEPDNARYVFYLAQSYRDAGDHEQALRTYRRRVDMGGWGEEVWVALYQIAQLEEKLEEPWPDVMQSYLAAYQFRPDRAEPLFRIAMHFQAAREFAVSMLFLSRAANLLLPVGNRLFVEKALYEYAIGVELAVASYYVGDHATSITTNNALLRSALLPPHIVEQVVRNRRYSVDALHEKKGGSAVGRVRVVVRYRNPGAELDETIESLLRQTDENFDVLCIDEGSAAAVPLPPSPRIELRRASLDEVVAEFAPDDIVLPLAPGQRLIAPNVITRIRSAFEDVHCALFYSQFRHPSGRLGNAEPASSAEAFRAAGSSLASQSAFAFRASLGADPWASADLARTVFFDDPLIAVASPRARAASSRVTVTGEALPKVSCLMITRDRLALARRAVRCFADQTYAHRELVIVNEGDDWYREALERYVAELGLSSDVRLITAPSDTPLGRLRNLSMEAATGEILCQWDDDDLSHPDRVSVQLDQLLRQNARACFLTDHLQYLEEDRALLWIDWTLSGNVTDEYQLFPGTVMLYKDARFRYPEEGPYARRGEDSMLVRDLYRSVPIARLSQQGHLYLYQFHGRNTFSKEHHYHIATCSATNEVVQARADTIREAARYYEIPKPIMVYGKSGPLFAVG
jgi:glycosyltransferase involved in cell wall biosynthesis